MYQVKTVNDLIQILQALPEEERQSELHAVDFEIVASSRKFYANGKRSFRIKYESDHDEFRKDYIDRMY